MGGIENPQRVVFELCLSLNFPTHNNKAEYVAFIVGLRSSSSLLVLELYNFRDSKLVVNQVTRKFEDWGAKMAKYLAMEKTLLAEF